MQAPPCPRGARIPELSYSSSLDPAVQKAPSGGKSYLATHQRSVRSLGPYCSPGVSNIDHSAGHEWQTLPSRPKVGAEPHAQPRPHEPSGRSALRSVELEIPISPVKGLSSSRTRKIAPANDSAQTSSEAITTRLVGANKVKLTKIAPSQKTRMIRNGVGMEPPPCVNKSSRVCAPSVKAAIARDCSERCTSLAGVRRSSSFSNADDCALASNRTGLAAGFPPSCQMPLASGSMLCLRRVRTGMASGPYCASKSSGRMILAVICLTWLVFWSNEP